MVKDRARQDDKMTFHGFMQSLEHALKQYDSAYNNVTWEFNDLEPVHEVPYYCDDCDDSHVMYYALTYGKNNQGYYIIVHEGDVDGNWDESEWIDEKLADQGFWEEFRDKWFGDLAWIDEAWDKHEEFMKKRKEEQGESECEF